MKKKKAGAAIVLYHFCAARDVRSIMENGLTKGLTPVFEDGALRFEHGTQWLTAEKDPAKQSWHTHTLVSYSRTAYRLTVSIPHSHRKKLHKAAEFIRQFPEENAGLVNDWEGSASWYVFQGTIPPAWIVGVQRTEAAP